MANVIEQRKVLFSLNKHAQRVNGVAWLGPTTLISIADSIIVWRGQGNDGSMWKAVQEIKTHKEQINYLEVLFVSETEQYFTTMCTGGVLKLHSLTANGEF